MEHTAAWGGPFEFQLAETNWTAEEEPAAGDAQPWAVPAAGHTLEYASIVDIFGSSCSLQPYAVPASSSSSSSGVQQQLVEYNYYNYYAAAAQHDGPVEKATTQDDLSFEEQMETYMNNPKKLFQERMEEFKDDAQFMKEKMHRYPPSIRALDADRQYTVPRVVAIGPYHHYGGDHLKEAEKVKHLAAIYCMNKSKLDVRTLYQEVVSAAAKNKARSLYDDKDVMAGMGYEDEFLPMMFYDACFLVMYMLSKSMAVESFDPDLHNFLVSNDDDIAHDIMLLENQIPWPVVDAVMKNCSQEPQKRMKWFIERCKRQGYLQDRYVSEVRVNWDERYYNHAPHLLGLFRFYVVGERSKPMVPPSDVDFKSVQFSASAIELAEMGIFLTANEETADEIPADLVLKKKWIIFAKLPVVPLSLNDLSASRLVNMAALELCTTPDFIRMQRENSAVCSYLLLLSMLIHREEDVHELRTKGILQGAGLTNNKTLDFFTSLQSLRKGRGYRRLMIEIEGYRMKRWGWWLWLYKFLYKNWKIITAVVSAVSAFAGILGTLMNLKGAH